MNPFVAGEKNWSGGFYSPGIEILGHGEHPKLAYLRSRKLGAPVPCHTPKNEVTNPL
jgi:hypothetical protein